VSRYLLNPNERTVAFMQDVLAETMALFPGPWIHVGGDEAVKDQWKASPRVQARMRELGIGNEAQLQSWFVRRIEKFLASHGRSLIGWDEILEGGIAPEATVMSWRGIDGAVTAARAGHDAVLSPWPTLYLDNRQSAKQFYPPGRGRVLPIEEIYAFDPLPPNLTPEQNAHILGVQGNLWTEHIRTAERVDYMAWPRGAAVAEIGWSPRERRDWPEFLARLVPQFHRYRALGVRNADVLFRVNVHGTLDLPKARGLVTLSNETGLGEIRYTTNGADPTPASQRYTNPLDLPLTTLITAATFVNGQRLGYTQRLLDASFFQRRTSHQLKLCSDRLTLSLEDDGPIVGERAVFLIDIMNPCWIDPAVDLSRGATLQAAVGQLPFNFQIGDDVKKIELLPPATPDGELVVFAGGCEGERIASLSLAPAVSQQAVTVLPKIALAPRAGAPQDLCFRFTQHSVDPMWAIQWIEIAP
jgi:hexosaminidase